jgi:hypothetical protein
MDFDAIYALIVVAVPIATGYIKQWVPERLRVLIPFVLGAAFTAIYGKEAGLQIQELLMQSFLIGSGSIGLYMVDKKLLKPTVDKKKAVNNGR